jgi:hypothetical protein
MRHRAVPRVGLIFGACSLALAACAAEPAAPRASVLQGVTALEKPVSYSETKIPLQLQSTTRLLHGGVLPARAFSLEIAYDARWTLRFYASLAPAQQQAIREGKQVSGSRWSPRQRALFEVALADAPPSGSGPKRIVPVRWDKAAVSMSSTAMIEYTEKGSGGQASGTRLASPARPGLWTKPPLPSHRAASPSVNAATPHRSVISDEGGTETREFTWVKLYLTGGPGPRQEYYLYYTAAVP